MKTRSVLFSYLLLSGLPAGNPLLGAVTPLRSPNELSGSAISLNFDGLPSATIANTLFQQQGLTLTRDDGQAVLIGDWALLGRTTTSPNNVLWTVWETPINGTYTTHLNVISSSPLFSIGAYFGNDQDNTDYSFTRLSIFGVSGGLLGNVSVSVNNNTSVDQFIGIASDVPFSQVRFENFSPSGGRSQSFSVVLDDLTFVPVPEPTILCLVGLAGVIFPCYARSAKTRSKP